MLKRLIVAFFCPLLAWGVTCPSGYTYYRTVTWDHTQAGASDSTNWPGLINASVTEWKTVGNSGHVQNTTTCCASTLTAPADLVFGDVSGTLYSWDVENYSASNASNTIVWLNLPTLSHTSDTVAYAYYGNSGVSTYQATASSTWNANYKAVWHLPNGTTLDLHDSTTNANTCTNSGTPATAAAAQIDGGMVTVGASSERGTCSNIAAFSNATTFTCEGWFKRTATSGFGGFCGQGSLNAAREDPIQIWNDGNIYYTISSTIFASFASNDTSLHHIVSVFNGAGAGNSGKIQMYLDGAAKTLSFTGTIPSTSPTTSSTFYLGFDEVNNQYQSGTMDEVRAMNVALGADWVTAEYNNQKSSSTMVTIGAENACAAPPPSAGASKVRKLQKYGIINFN